MGSLLIAEDDPNWRIPLRQMYKEILPKDWSVKAEESGAEVLEILESGKKFDIISLDINLHTTCGLVTDSLTADGRTIIRRARELKACKALIVITGLPYDENLDFIIPDLKDRVIFVSTLNDYLEEWFGGHQISYTKPPDDTIPVEEFIKVLKTLLHQKKLIDLCESAPWHYVIEIYNPDPRNPDIGVRRKGKRDKFIPMRELDSKLLLEMIDAKETDIKKFVSRERVSEIYFPSNPEKYSQAMSDFKRYLDRVGVKAEDLILIEYKKGCRLAPSVEIKYKFDEDELEASKDSSKIAKDSIEGVS